MLYHWAKSSDHERCEIAVVFERSFNRCSHHGSVALVLSLCNDRFIAEYAVYECSTNKQSFSCTHLTVGKVSKQKESAHIDET